MNHLPIIIIIIILPKVSVTKFTDNFTWDGCWDYIAYTCSQSYAAERIESAVQNLKVEFGEQRAWVPTA